MNYPRTSVWLIMATNQYFNKFKNTAEQTLVQDLVDETIKIHGVDMVYVQELW